MENRVVVTRRLKGWSLDESGYGYEKAIKNMLQVMEILNIHTINVNTVEAILYHNFSRRYHWRKKLMGT